MLFKVISKGFEQDKSSCRQQAHFCACKSIAELIPTPADHFCSPECCIRIFRGRRSGARAKIAQWLQNKVRLTLASGFLPPLPAPSPRPLSPHSPGCISRLRFRLRGADRAAPGAFLAAEPLRCELFLQCRNEKALFLVVYWLKNASRLSALWICSWRGAKVTCDTTRRIVSWSFSTTSPAPATSGTI